MNFIRITRRTKYSYTNGVRNASPNLDPPPNIQLDFPTIRRQQRTPEEREIARIDREARAAARAAARAGNQQLCATCQMNIDDDVEMVMPKPIMDYDGEISVYISDWAIIPFFNMPILFSIFQAV